MKPSVLKKRVLIVMIVVFSSMFMVADTIYLPLVAGGAGAAAGEEVFISAGTFQMGCYDPFNADQSINCPAETRPLHPVFLDDYYIDKFELTNANYKVCVTAGKCAPPSNTTYFDDAVYADDPVGFVDWGDARAYCEWAGKRLPTEAEWEKAARGDGYPRTYPWGEAIPDIRWVNFGNVPGDSAPVDFYPRGASPYGVMNMVGNVNEWVNDWYLDDYYSEQSALNNPIGPAEGKDKINRGGSHISGDVNLYLSYRNASSPDVSVIWTGFRCARTP